MIFYGKKKGKKYESIFNLFTRKKKHLNMELNYYLDLKLGSRSLI